MLIKFKQMPIKTWPRALGNWIWANWPDTFSWKGSVLPATLPPVIMMSIFSSIICLVHVQFGIYLGLPGSVVPAISVTLGLLLAFRVNTAYDRFTEARLQFQKVTTTIRNLARLIWINVPEKTERDHVEKMRCVKLLLAFAVATKRHLRQEYGIDYPDLASLLPKDWVSTMTSAQPIVPEPEPAPKTFKLKTKIAAMMSLRQAIFLHDNQVIPDSEIVSSPATMKPPTPLFPQNDDINDIANMRKTDDMENDEDATVPFLMKTQPTLVKETETTAIRKRSQSKLNASPISGLDLAREEGSSTAASSIRSGSFRSSEDLPDEQDADMNLPLEILFRISLFINQAKAAGKIESPFVVSCSGSIDALVNSLTAFERIRHTPIPKAYDIHLKQGVALYVFTLPFTLVAEMGFLMIPIVALVTFTLFGVIAIGSQIENPFGYDSNDLPLSHYCEQLKKEVEWVIYHVPTSTQTVLLNGV
ncbi:hypothetical protein INT43_000932 [Umbelopsis isabellina]|uniref:Bestrophin, RFP-TM, chloride channel-domain-containing protein n=1 Tax=Mortierella isabellina TaxID=91625 RepID=A0A8H7UN84_MORIS|nr:hypothetical protein INT43_000932 [Umbelopsis isabellina]